MRAHYDLVADIIKCMGLTSFSSSPLGSVFPDASSFINFITNERKFLAREESWRSAVIKDPFGGAQKGVFRDASLVIKEALREAGGAAAIMPHTREADQAGERAHSAVWNSRAAQSIVENADAGSKHLLFSLYADGAMLVKSGSVDATIARMRAENLKKRSCRRWRELGISPALVMGGAQASEEKKREARSAIFHRFLFLALQKAVEGEKCGFTEDGEVVRPHLISIARDQPQERELFCLKGAGSVADCSFCLAHELKPPRKTKRQKRRRNAIGYVGAQPLEGRPKSVEGETAESDSDFEEEGGGEGSLEGAQPLLQLVRSDTDQAQQRSTRDAVKMQLELSTLKATSPKAARGRISFLSAKLAAESARSKPSSLACFISMASGPSLLFQSAQLDMLHACDLGPTRDCCDLSCDALGSESYGKGRRSKASLVKVANERLRDLPRQANIARRAQFKANISEAQSAMTGKQRREVAPFLWVAIMGLKVDSRPDDVELLQAALMLDRARCELKGVNKSSVEMERAEKDIENVSKICFEAFKAFSIALQRSVSAKLHRLMHHSRDQLKIYGSAQTESAGKSEEMHKGAKKPFSAANQRLGEIPEQMLNVNIAAAIEESGDEGPTSHGSAITRLLMTRSPAVELPQRSEGVIEGFALDAPPAGEAHRSEEHEDAVKAALAKVRSTVSSSRAMEEADRAVEAMACPFRGSRMWKRAQSTRIPAKLEWERAATATHAACGGDNIWKAGPRRDGAVCDADNEGHTRARGFAQGIFKSRGGKWSIEFALARRLRRAPGDHGNRKITDELGIPRCAYHSSIDLRESSQMEGLALDVAPAARILRGVILAPDVWDLVLRKGRRLRMSDIPGNPSERSRARLFEIKSFPLASFSDPAWSEEKNMTITHADDLI